MTYKFHGIVLDGIDFSGIDFFGIRFFGIRISHANSWFLSSLDRVA